MQEVVSSLELDSVCFFDLYLYTSKENTWIKHISTSFKGKKGNSYCLAKLFVPNLLFSQNHIRFIHQKTTYKQYTS